MTDPTPPPTWSPRRSTSPDDGRERPTRGLAASTASARSPPAPTSARCSSASSSRTATSCWSPARWSARPRAGWSTASREDAIRDETVRVVARRGPDLDRGEPPRPGDGRRRHRRLQHRARHRRAAARRPGRDRARPARRGCTTTRGRNVAVLVTDTAGRAWRTGQTDLAVGAAGLEPLDDHAGRTDGYGNPLAVTAPAVADELAVGRRAGHRQARRPTGLRGPRAGRPGAPRRASTARVPARSSAALGGHVRPRSPRGRPGRRARRRRRLLRSPAPTEEVLAAMESCGLRAVARVRRCGSSCRPSPATRSPRPSACGSWPTPTAGDRTATRRVAGLRLGVPTASVDSPTHAPGSKADDGEEDSTRDRAACASSSRCGASRRARSAPAASPSSAPASSSCIGLLAAALIPYIKDQREKSRLAERQAERDRRLRVGSRAATTSRPRRTRCRSRRTRPTTCRPEAPSTTRTPRPPSATTGPTSCPARRSAPSTPSTTGPRSSGSSTARSTGTRSSGTTTRIKAGLGRVQGRSSRSARSSASTPTSSPRRGRQQDGGSFPDGKHVALTHWTGKNEGVTQFCTAPSGEVVGRRS